MKPCSSTIVFISLVVTLFFVTLVTLLSSNAHPQKTDVLCLSMADKDN
ncbi:MAG: hypothetical protein V4580_18955 [Bacteroidota bacterium]